MYRWVCVIALCTILMGCRDPSSELVAALRKIPLPPGNEGFSFDESDTPTSFFIRANYRGKTATEISEFYRVYFSENGWKNLNSPGHERTGSLLYQKGKAEVGVTVFEADPAIHLMVYYSEHEYTHEEFDALVRESAAPEAVAIIEKVAATYGGVESYADTGHHEDIHEGELLSELSFKTKYLASGDFHFEYTSRLSNGFEDSGVLSKTGNVIQGMCSYDEAPREFEDISAAIGSFYGLSDGTSRNIPDILFGDETPTLFGLAHLRVIDESKLKDGTRCVRIQGKDFNGEETSVWVSIDDHVVRKIECVADKDNRSTTTYKPEINAKISVEEMAFRSP